MRRQIEVSNEVAQALTGAGDHILRKLRPARLAVRACR